MGIRELIIAVLVASPSYIDVNAGMLGSGAMPCINVITLAVQSKVLHINNNNRVSRSQNKMHSCVHEHGYGYAMLGSA
jgi:hypothetical protein